MSRPLTKLHTAALDLSAQATVAMGRASGQVLRPGVEPNSAVGASPIAPWLTLQPCERVEAWRLALVGARHTRSTPNTLAILEEVREAILVDLGRNTARHSVFDQMVRLLDPDTPGTLNDPVTAALHDRASDFDVPSVSDAGSEEAGRAFATALDVGHASAVREIQKRLRLSIDDPLNEVRGQFGVLTEASAVNVRLATVALLGTPWPAISPAAGRAAADLNGESDDKVWRPVETLIETMGQATGARRLLLAETARSVRNPELAEAMAAARQQNSSENRSITLIDTLTAEADAILSLDAGMEGLL